MIPTVVTLPFPEGHKGAQPRRCVIGLCPEVRFSASRSLFLAQPPVSPRQGKLADNYTQHCFNANLTQAAQYCRRC